MTSTKELEDTLPFYPPKDEDEGQWQASLHQKYAAYSLVPLDDAGQQRLLNDLNTGELSTKNCCLAPQPDFAGRTLRDVYDYHIEAREIDDNEIHPHFFVVADQEDWTTKGVLVVNLRVMRELGDDVDGGWEYAVGVGRCGVDMADCVFCNLDIANMDWVEFKEEWQQEWGGEDPYKNKRYFKHDPTED